MPDDAKGELAGAVRHPLGHHERRGAAFGIEKTKQLLDSGAITQQEFAAVKAKALMT